MLIEEEEDLTRDHMRIPPACNEVAGILSEIDPNLIECSMVRRMKERAEIGSFASAAGSLKGHDGLYLLEDESLSGKEHDSIKSDDDESTIYVDDEDVLLNQLVEDVLVGAIDLDEVMAVNTGKPSGVKAEHLAKV